MMTLNVTDPQVATLLTLIASAGSVLFKQFRAGRAADRRHKELSATVGEISNKVNTFSGELRSLKELAIGIDGTNGLRGELRQVQADVRDIQDIREPRLVNRRKTPIPRRKGDR